MRDTLLLLFLVIITICIFVYTTKIKDGFTDASDTMAALVKRQEAQYSDIGINLVAAGTQGSLGNSANSILKTVGTSKDYPLPPTKDGLWAMIDKCEAVKTMDCSAFDDPAFTLNCGLCLDIGKNSKLEPATGGLVLVPGDKQVARENTHSGFLPDYNATVGFCPAGKMVSTKAECLKLQRELLCAKNASYNLPGCSQCYSDTTYSIVDEQTSPGVITGSGTISIMGRGSVIVQEQGYDASKPITLSATRHHDINIRGSEGTRIKFSLNPPLDSDPDNPVIPYMSGYLSGPTFGGIFDADLRRIVLTDEVSGRKPRTSGKDTVNGTILTRMAPAFGQTAANIVVIVPFSFVETTMSEATKCKDAPFVTQQSSSEFLGSDPCYVKGAGPGKYNLECLQGAWTSNGCVESGKGYPTNNASAAALMVNPDNSLRSINDISNFIYNMALITSTGMDEDGQKKEMKDWSAASLWCTGRELSSPCDTSAKNSGPLSPDCLNYLWMNQGMQPQWNGKSNPIGPTYSDFAHANVANLEKGDLRGCKPTGTMAPIDANGKVNQKALAFWHKQGGVNNVKNVMKNMHATASADKLSDEQREQAFSWCYGTTMLAPRPVTKFKCATNLLPQSFTPKQSNVLVQSMMITEDYTLSFDVTPTGIVHGGWGNLFHFTSNDTDWGALGSRTPGIWFWPGTLGLHVNLGGSGDANRGFDAVPGISIGKKSRVSIVCNGDNYKVIIDGVETTRNQPSNRYSGPAKVYGGGPWHPPALCTIENVCMTQTKSTNTGVPNVQFIRIEGTGRADIMNFSQLVALDENGKNVTKGRPTQSTGAGWGTRSSTAVDGNEQPRAFPGNFAADDGKGTTLWQVQLDGPTTISSVTIYNRTDCCANRLASGYVVKMFAYGAATATVIWQSKPLTGDHVQKLITKPSTSVPFQNVNGNNGTVTCETYCRGVHNGSWNGELPNSWNGASCVSTPNFSGGCNATAKHGITCSCAPTGSGWAQKAPWE